MEMMSPAHLAVELADFSSLVQLYTEGIDFKDEYDGLTLLQHAIAVEVDSHTQQDTPLCVDGTALLLAMGADPRHRNNAGVTAMDLAASRGHWLAGFLIDTWLREHPQR